MANGATDAKRSNGAAAAAALPSPLRPPWKGPTPAPWRGDGPTESAVAAGESVGGGSVNTVGRGDTGGWAVVDGVLDPAPPPVRDERPVIDCACMVSLVNAVKPLDASGGSVNDTGDFKERGAVLRGAPRSDWPEMLCGCGCCWPPTVGETVGGACEGCSLTLWSSKAAARAIGTAAARGVVSFPPETTALPRVLDAAPRLGRGGAPAALWLLDDGGVGCT